MPQGDKSSYSSEQSRKAAHIEENYAFQGAPKGEAEKRASATVIKESGGGNERVWSRETRHQVVIAQERRSWRQGVDYPHCGRTVSIRPCIVRSAQ